MVELEDTLDLGSSVERHAGSTPVIGTACFTNIYRTTRWVNSHYFIPFNCIKNFNCVCRCAKHKLVYTGRTSRKPGSSSNPLKEVWNLCKNISYFYCDIIISSRENSFIGLSPSGKARDFDSRTRGFESHQPSSVFWFLQRPPPPTAVAVTKGDSNSPGGFCLYRHWLLLGQVARHCPSTVVTQVRFLQKRFIRPEA